MAIFILLFPFKNLEKCFGKILADKIKLNNVFYEFFWNYEFGMVSKEIFS
jgi:hypothetical protein